MAQKQLSVPIIITGKVDDKFSKLSGELEQMASRVKLISDHLVEFGKESLEEYMSYEDYMLAIQGRLQTSGDISEGQMEQLGKQIKTWAASSRFTTTEMAEAVANAAQAGWELDQIYAGIPSVMSMAAGSNMDIADSMDYLTSAMAGLGLGYDDMDMLVDMWLYTANSSKATAKDIGETMEKMGSTMQFAANPEEIMTMIGIMAEFGTKGATAGTLLRNTMLRMISPTKAARDQLEALAITEDEFADYNDDWVYNEEQAEQAMTKLGLSAFDSEGNLRSFLDIVRDIDNATSGMTDQEKYTALGTIFPTRTITGILNLIKGVNGEWDTFGNSLTRNSSGYAADIAALQESGLGGAYRLFNSKLQLLKINVGDAISEEATTVLNALGSAAESLANIDPAVMNGIVAAAETIAGVGGGLATAAVALKVLGFLFTPLGAGTIAAAGIFGLVGYLNALNEINYNNTFGDVALDLGTLKEAIDGLGLSEDGYNAEWMARNQEILQQGEKYAGLATGFNSSLISNSISGLKLTEKQKTELLTVGDSMVKAVLGGINLSRDNFLTAAQGLNGNDTDGTFLMNALMGANYFTQLEAEAKSIGETLRSQMVEALADDQINAEEQRAIDATVKRLSEIEQKIMEIAAYENYGEMLYNASHLTKDGIEDFAKYFNEQYAAENAEYDAMMRQMYGTYYARMMTGTISQDDYNARIAELEAKRAARQSDTDARYAGFAQNAIDQVMYSQYGTSWDVVKSWMNNGEFSAGQFSANDIKNASGQWNNMYSTMQMFGGMASVAGYNGLNENSWRDIHKAWYNAPKTVDVPIEAKPDLESVDAAMEEIRARAGNGYINVGFNRGGDHYMPLPTQMFANGGRATEASIFGEAGAEWAIPEEHTKRTADLLQAAAAASGFSWADLLGMYGGLNSGSGRSAPVVYSPTIYAQDATGVEQKLKEDKERFERWWQERKLRDSMEVYA